MTRREAWLHHLSNLLVGGTGLVYAWTLYFAEADPDDPFAVANHPWQEPARDLHLLGAPLLVFACGLIWRSHVWGRIQSGFPTRRRSGWALVTSLVPMAASGYLIQVSVDEAWRRVWVWIHVAASCLWMAGYLWHQVSSREEPSADSRMKRAQN